MIGVNWAIFESYSGSDVQGSQKKGRLHRLNVDEMANVIIIVVKGTQYESWFNNAFPFVKNPRIIKSIDEFPIVSLEFYYLLFQEFVVRNLP